MAGLWGLPKLSVGIAVVIVRPRSGEGLAVQVEFRGIELERKVFSD